LLITDIAKVAWISPGFDSSPMKENCRVDVQMGDCGERPGDGSHRFSAPAGWFVAQEWPFGRARHRHVPGFMKHVTGVTEPAPVADQCATVDRNSGQEGGIRQRPLLDTDPDLSQNVDDAPGVAHGRNGRRKTTPAHRKQGWDAIGHWRILATNGQAGIAKSNGGGVAIVSGCPSLVAGLCHLVIKDGPGGRRRCRSPG
jgi:hypothetical protein